MSTLRALEIVSAPWLAFDKLNVVNTTRPVKLVSRVMRLLPSSDISMVDSMFHTYSALPGARANCEPFSMPLSYTVTGLRCFNSPTELHRGSR